MIVVSNSMVKLWRKCPQAYHYRWVQGIEHRRHTLPLVRGTLVHELIENYYLGKDWKKILARFEKEFNQLMEEEKEYYGDLPGEAKRLMEGYVKKYSGQKEKPLAVELSFYDNPVPLTDRVALTGKIDLILENKEGVWVTEHKTHKQIPNESDRLTDLQTVIYIKMAEHAGFKGIRGVMWDYLRTKAPTVPYVLRRGGLTRKKKLDTDYDTFMQAILDNKLDPKDYIEELERAAKNPFYIRRYMPRSEAISDRLIRELEITALQMEKLKDFPYRHLNKFNCQGCEFRSLCEAELMGLDSSFIRAKEYKKAEPRGEVNNEDGYQDDEEEAEDDGEE